MNNFYNNFPPIVTTIKGIVQLKSAVQLQIIYTTVWRIIRSSKVL